MSTSLRIATFNLENLDDKPNEEPSLTKRIAIMKPQLMRIRADVLCLQEVHGQEQSGQPRDLLALKELIKGTDYETFHLATTMTTSNEVYDERNLVVLSRYPILSTQQIKHDYIPKPAYRKVMASPAEQAKDITWERPIFYVTIDIGHNRTLHVLVVHMKSKIPTNIEGQKINTYTWRTVPGWAEGYFVSSMKRVGQSLEARVIIDDIFDNHGVDSLIAMCGDFNADSDTVPVNAIRGMVEETGNPELGPRVMAPCENTIPESSRFSILHLGKGEMLDHILVSRSLLAYYRGTEIHNEIIPDESGAFRTDTKFPESDHAPVIAEFEMP